jgi:hypothetical protein
MKDLGIDRTTLIALPAGIAAMVVGVILGSLAALAQTPAPGSTVAPPATTQERDLVGLPVRDRDGKAVGYVTRIDRAPSGKIERVEISAGGFLGFGARSLLISPDRMEPGKDEVTLMITYDEVQRQLR